MRRITPGEKPVILLQHQLLGDEDGPKRRIEYKAIQGRQRAFK